jgi:hypothetical protein
MVPFLLAQVPKNSDHGGTGNAEPGLLRPVPSSLGPTGRASGLTGVVPVLSLAC